MSIGFVLGIVFWFYCGWVGYEVEKFDYETCGLPYNHSRGNIFAGCLFLGVSLAVLYCSQHMFERNKEIKKELKNGIKRTLL